MPHADAPPLTVDITLRGPRSRAGTRATARRPTTILLRLVSREAGSGILETAASTDAVGTGGSGDADGHGRGDPRPGRAADPARTRRLRARSRTRYHHPWRRHRPCEPAYGNARRSDRGPPAVRGRPRRLRYRRRCGPVRRLVVPAVGL